MRKTVLVMKICEILLFFFMGNLTRIIFSQKLNYVINIFLFGGVIILGIYILVVNIIINSDKKYLLQGTKREIKIYDVKEELPQNYEQVIIIGDSIVTSGKFINGLFECDDLDLYGVVNENDNVDGANVFIVKQWIPSISLLYDDCE